MSQDSEFLTLEEAKQIAFSLAEKFEKYVKSHKFIGELILYSSIDPTNKETLELSILQRFTGKIADTHLTPMQKAKKHLSAEWSATRRQETIAAEALQVTSHIGVAPHLDREAWRVPLEENLRPSEISQKVQEIPQQKLDAPSTIQNVKVELTSQVSLDLLESLPMDQDSLNTNLSSSSLPVALEVSR